MSTTPVYTYTYDHIHVRTKDPEGMASFFETMFGAKVLRLTQSDGVPRVDLDVNGLAIFIASVPPEEHIDLSPRDSHLGLDHFGFRVDDIDGAVEDLRSKGAEIYVPSRVPSAPASVSPSFAAPTTSGSSCCSATVPA